MSFSEEDFMAYPQKDELKDEITGRMPDYDLRSDDTIEDDESDNY